MNWLLVGVLFTLAFCTIKGYQKGFIRVAFSLVSFFLVIAFVTWAEPYISDYLENNTGIYTAIQEKCEEQLKKSVENGRKCGRKRTGIAGCREYGRRYRCGSERRRRK